MDVASFRATVVWTFLLGCLVALADDGPAAGATEEARISVRWTSEGLVRRPQQPPTGGNAIRAGGAVYLAGDERGRVVALDRRTGRVRWRSSPGRGHWALLQGATRRVVVVSSVDRVVALDARTGQVRWELSLAALGLHGYQAVTSVATEPTIAVGVSRSGEGPSPPPAVLGVSSSDGALRWHTDLTPDTELTFPSPATDGTDAVFVTTPSGPERGDNVAHLLALDSGRMHWATGLGGFQAFGVLPALLGDESVLLQPVRTSADLDQSRTAGRTTSVGRSDGAVQWTVDGILSTRIGREVWGIEATGAVVVLDRHTGARVRTVRDPRPSDDMFASRLVDLGAGRIGVVAVDRLTVIDRRGRRLATTRLRAPLVAPLIVERGGVIATTADDVTTAYAIR